MNRQKAFQLIQSYLLNSSGLTLRQISLLLCQDMGISYRCARENYVLPLKEHKVLIPISDYSIYFIFNLQCHISKSDKIFVKNFVTSSNKNNGVSGDAVE